MVVQLVVVGRVLPTLTHSLTQLVRSVSVRVKTTTIDDVHDVHVKRPKKKKKKKEGSPKEAPSRVSETASRANQESAFTDVKYQKAKTRKERTVVLFWTERRTASSTTR